MYKGFPLFFSVKCTKTHIYYAMKNCNGDANELKAYLVNIIDHYKVYLSTVWVLPIGSLWNWKKDSREKKLLSTYLLEEFIFSTQTDWSFQLSQGLQMSGRGLCMQQEATHKWEGYCCIQESDWRDDNLQKCWGLCDGIISQLIICNQCS